jgi:membrane protease YdiL (CAAX protease family)
VPQPSVALVGSLILGIVLAVASWALGPRAATWIPQLGNEVQALYATLHRAPGPLRAVPILALSVLAEELIWRGAIVDWLLSKNLSAAHVTLLATAAYVLPMVCSGSWLLVAVALTLGTVLTIQRLYLRSWLPCFVTHLTWNVLIFVVHPVL